MYQGRFVNRPYVVIWEMNLSQGLRARSTRGSSFKVQKFKVE